MRSLPGSYAIPACLVAASVLVLGTEAGAVVFNDGLVHVIDANNSFPLEAFSISIMRASTQIMSSSREWVTA